MPHFTRYVLLELLKVFLVTLFAMTLFMVLVGVAREAVRQGLGLAPILRLLPYVLPNALRFAVPGTILFAACSVYGRMAANNEVLVIKSLGLSPMRVVWPALILAFMISLITVWLNDVAVSWGRMGVNRVVIQSVEQIAYGMLRTNRTYNGNKLSINVKRVDGHKLVRPTIMFHETESSPAVMITAQEAEMRYNPDQEALSIYLTNGEIDVGDSVHGVFPDTIEREIPLTAASRKADLSAGPSDLALRDIPEASRRQQQAIQSLRQRFAAAAATQMLTGQFEELTDPQWNKNNQELWHAQARLNRLSTEPWRRWANGFSCLFFVMVGAPLAIRLRNSDLWTTFAICFLPILLAYYPLLMYGVDRAKGGALPPYCVWLGNGVLFVVGAILLRKMGR